VTVRVVGVDLSLTSTGIARLTIPADGPPQTWTGTVGDDGEKDATLWQRWVRLDALAEGVIEEVISNPQPDLVLIEQPAYGAKFGHPHDRSGAWWAVVDSLIRRGLAVAEVNATHVKMWATGRGNAPKTVVTQRIMERYGHLFDAPPGPGRGDICDAISLATLGAAHLGHPVGDPVPDTHARALAAVRWPTAVPTGDLQ
jgi:crossover junction endodeoxyribonuclease RuvC